jgi:hypothetical protein
MLPKDAGAKITVAEAGDLLLRHLEASRIGLLRGTVESLVKQIARYFLVPAP